MSDEKSATPGHEAWIEFLVDHPTRGGLAESLIFMAGYDAGSKASPDLLAALEALTEYQIVQISPLGWRCEECKEWGNSRFAINHREFCKIGRAEAAIKTAKG